MAPPLGSDATWDADEGDAPAPPAPPEERYVLGALIGEGGLAEVFEARDLLLQRVVAIKRLRAADRGAAARFVREAEVAAALAHPGVVPVYDLGEDAQGRPFLAMKRVEGRALSELPREGPGTEERLELFRRVLDTVAFAHARGFLHRDLKGDNVMVGAFGEVLVMDWGLALRLDEAARPRGVVAGTPSCMAPEQARGEALDVRADVYGLGAVLFTLLTGRAPREGSAEEAIALARQGVIQAPRALAPDVSRELEAVLLKALAPRPEDRYPSALALREDIDAVLLRRPLTHVSSTPAERLGKWAWRHRGPVRVAAVAAGLGAIGLLLGLTRYSADLGRARDLALAEADRARRAEHQARQGEALARVALADQRRAAGRVGEAAAHLDAAAALLGEAAEGSAVLTLARAELAAESPLPLAVCHPHGGAAVLALDLAPDGLSAWTWGADGRLVTWDTATCAVRQAVSLVGEPGQGALSLASGLAVVSSGEAVVLLDHDGRELERRPGRALLMGFDGAVPWVFTADRALRTLGPGGRPLSVPPEVGLVRPAQGGRLRVGDSRPFGTALGGVWTAEGAARFTAPGVNAAALEPDGEHLLVLGADHLDRVHLATGEVQSHDVGAPGSLLGLSPEGERLWIIGFDGGISVHDVETGAPRLRVAPTDAPHLAALSDGGSTLAAGGSAGAVRVWRVPERPPRRPLGPGGDMCQGLAVSPDGRLLAAACGDTVTLYERRALVPLRTWSGLGSSARELRFSPDGLWLAVAAREAGVVVLGLDGAREDHPLKARTVAVDWLPDGALVTVDVEGDLHLREAGGGPFTLRGRVQDGATWSVTAVDAEHVLVGGHTGVRPGLRRVHARRGEVVQELPCEGDVYHHDVSPDGRRLAVASGEGEVWIWTAEGALLRRLEADGGPTLGVAFSPDGRWLASTGYGEGVRIWEVETGALLRAVEQHVGPGLNLAFTPDGGQLWSGGADGLALLPLDTHLRHLRASEALGGVDEARRAALIELAWWERALAEPEDESPELRALALLARGEPLSEPLLVALPEPWARALRP